MSTQIEGRVVSDETDPNTGQNAVLPDLNVALFSGAFKLGSGFTDSNGRFKFNYRRDPNKTGGHRQLVIQIRDVVGRIVATGDPFDDTSQDFLTEFDLQVPGVEAKGFLVTLGTQKTSGPGWGLDEGASVKFLIDNEAFQKAAVLFQGARDFIYFSQLFFPLPIVFAADATREDAQLVFDFHPPPPDASHLRAAGVGDSRPERLLLEAADRDVDVRILLHAFKAPLFVRILAGILVFPFAGTDGVSLLETELFGSALTDADADEKYFADSGRQLIKVKPFFQSPLSAGVMHAKLMIVDGERALSIGSPFGQSYVDSHGHIVDEPERGDSHDFPKHDAGFIAKGPVIRTIYDTVKRLWDNAAPDDKLQDYPPTPPDSHHGASVLPDDDWEAQCSIQIVRTLSAKKFDDIPDGEKGILEAYLRAINSAKDFIYFETQYFTNNAIGDAIVSAMNHNKQLQVIMLLNIRPDVPFYPWKQRRLIHRIRKGIKKDQPSDPDRFGVFTRWSHNFITPRPQLLPIYIHAKVAVVDDTWCTVGSANLDGLSLDNFLLNPFVEQRAIEVNAIMLNGVDGQPASEAPGILRRKLWAEHLEFRDSAGNLNINAPDLREKPNDGWLSLWNNHSKGTLSLLVNNPAQAFDHVAHILPWPNDNTTHKTPRDYLTTLGIESFRVEPLKGTRGFDFKSGQWKNKAALDY